MDRWIECGFSKFGFKTFVRSHKLFDHQNLKKKDFVLTRMGQINGRPQHVMPLATVTVGAKTAVVYLTGYTLSIIRVEVEWLDNCHFNWLRLKILVESQKICTLNAVWLH